MALMRHWGALCEHLLRSWYWTPSKLGRDLNINLGSLKIITSEPGGYRKINK